MNDRGVGEELRHLLGRPLDNDEREHARKLVVATDAIERTILAASHFVALAHEALATVPSAGLRVGFSSLITSLVEDLPGI